ncbi:MAG: tetratricopeptide repeat protein [Armatimonadota bacterium]
MATMRAELRPADRMRQALTAHLDHEGVQTLLEMAATCDEANDYLQNGDYELALQTALPLVLLQTPVVAERAREIALNALDHLVDQAMMQGMPRRALDYLQQWLRLEPNALYPMVRRAEILQFDIGDYDAAWTAYLQVLRHHPNNIEALIGLAELSLMEGNPERAYPYVLRAWQTLAQSRWAYTPSVRTFTALFEGLYDVTAGVLAWLGPPEEAERLLEEAIRRLGGSEALSRRLQSLREILARDAESDDKRDRP